MITHVNNSVPFNSNFGIDICLIGETRDLDELMMNELTHPEM